MNDPIHLEPTKSDAEEAIAIRNKLRPILEQACGVVADARRKGLIVGFNIAPDAVGRIVITTIDVNRPL